MKKARDHRHKGVLWLKESNNKYKTIIGAREIQFQQTNQWICDCIGMDVPVQDPGECGLMGCQPTIGSNVEKVIIERPNDGVVLAESSAAFPNAAVGMALVKSNHQQMRNDENTKKALNGLFEGNYGEYFVTKPR